jgi:Ser/Thr protein kinase RdoA (MazF antagonist)
MAEAIKAVERTGTWLKDFQAWADGSVTQEVGFDAWRTELRENLKGAVGVLSPALRARTESSVSRFCEEPANPSLVPAAQHGDFWPGNVMATPEGVQVLDFEGYRPGVAWEDPAYFLLQAGFFFGFPLLRRRFGAVRSAFLRGYGSTDPPQEEGYRACRVSVCLRLLARAASASGCDSSGGRRHLDRLRAALHGAVS